MAARIVGVWTAVAGIPVTAFAGLVVGLGPGSVGASGCAGSTGPSVSSAVSSPAAAQAGEDGGVTLSDVDVARFAFQAGFRGDDLVTDVEIANAESGRRTGATNHNSNGSTDYGVMQINDQAHPDLPVASGNWRSPLVNEGWAFTVFSQAGGSWSPWTTFRSGAYKFFKDEAVSAVNALRGDGVAVDASPPVAALSTPVGTASSGGDGSACVLTVAAASDSALPNGGLASDGWRKRIVFSTLWGDRIQHGPFTVMIPPGERGAAINWALDQIGKTYVFGASGPVSFDCSGLVGEAIRVATAGRVVIPRTTSDEWTSSLLTRPDVPQPGDLLYSEVGENFAGLPGHVTMLIGQVGGVAYVVSAPQTGDLVQIHPLSAEEHVAGYRTVQYR